MGLINGGTKRAIPSSLVTAVLCAVAFLLVAGYGNTADRTATPVDHIEATSFRCITKMTPVRHFYVDNLQGDLAATLAVANSPTGGVYPPGSVIQLVPGEAMVKRDKGFNTATHDWEFFELDVSKDGNCFACHIAARPQWDLVCEADHGCAPIALTRAMSGALQRTDPRCDHAPVSAEDAVALKQLNELFKPR